MRVWAKTIVKLEIFKYFYPFSLVSFNLKSFYFIFLNKTNRKKNIEKVKQSPKKRASLRTKKTRSAVSATQTTNCFCSFKQIEFNCNKIEKLVFVADFVFLYLFLEFFFVILFSKYESPGCFSSSLRSRIKYSDKINKKKQKRKNLFVVKTLVTKTTANNNNKIYAWENLRRRILQQHTVPHIHTHTQRERETSQSFNQLRTQQLRQTNNETKPNIYYFVAKV